MLIITTTLSSSSHFTYFFAVVAFLSVGSGKKLKENLMGEGNLKTKRLNSFKSFHNIKLRVTDSSKKSSCEASRRLDRKVLIRLPIKTHFVPTKDFVSRSSFYHYCHHHHHWGGVIICVLEKQSLMTTIVFTPYYR
jgi:hypothetical protein